MKRNLFFIIVSAAIAFTSCTEVIQDLGITPEVNVTPDEELTVKNGGIIDRIFNRKTPKKSNIQLDSNEAHYTLQGNVFAAELFHTLCKDHQTENLSISPLSLQVALSMLANGMNDDACRELINVMLKEDVPLADLNTFYHKMRDGMEESGSVALANALWAQEGFPINPTFIETCKLFYDAEAGNLDFGNTSATSDSISQWAYDHTYGKIRDLKLAINDATKLVLANAIWFGANWDYPFIVDSTKTTTFHPAYEYEDIDVSMMHKIEWMYYCIKPDYRMITIPFKFKSFSLLVAQPTNGDNVVDMLPNVDWSCTGLGLTPDSCTNGWRRGDVHLGMPKFTFRNSFILSNKLYELGMQKMFMGGAFNGISNGLDMSIIQQDTYSSIDEEGCEFAGITSIYPLMFDIDSGGSSPQPYEFILDHPFAFAIRENSTGTLLFLGKVERP